MKIAIIGYKGMLGSDIYVELSNSGHEIIGLDIEDIDIAKKENTNAVLLKIKPAIIINCAAYTNVDGAESERETTYAVNSLGPKHLAQFCKKHDAILYHFSTDYVFDGKKETPYIETDSCSPINFYGKSKLDGELNIINYCRKYYIFRIQWLYGKNGSNFVKTIINLSKEKQELAIVNDQYGSPTWTKSIASSISKTLQNPIDFGVYHLSNQGYTTWYNFAEFFLNKIDSACHLKTTTSKLMKRPAQRPQNSLLSLKKILSKKIICPQSWQEAICDYLKENSFIL
jgi:dTDP-4-dehydrorhamnose reductase